MNKTELVAAMADQAGLSKKDAEKALKAFTDVVSEELKKDGMFDKVAQKNAQNKCLELIKTNMSADVKKWLEENYTDIDTFLKSSIEATIGLLKNKSCSTKVLIDKK